MNYFPEKELRCKCGCGAYDMDEMFMYYLNRVREVANIPFIITSGYRCPAHNEKVGGSKTSSHLIGKAVDISCTNSKDRHIMIENLCFHFNRIGIGKDFIHVDMDDNKPEYRIWVY